MKKVSLVLALVLFAATASFAQILEPVKWQFAVKKTSKTEAVVFMKAVINPGWHIYSQTVKEGGPIKTSFTFAPSKDFTLVGKPGEPKPKTKMEEVFNMEVPYFDNEVVFQQKVKLVKGQAIVKGIVEFMACDATRCLPPEEVEFSVAVK